MCGRSHPTTIAPLAATNPHAFAHHAGLLVTLDPQQHAAVAPPSRPRFIAPREDASEPPARVLEYVRPPRSGRVEPLASWSERPWPVSPHSGLPNGLIRLLVVWGLLTLASLVGPCRPLSPSPALAAEASP